MQILKNIFRRKGRAFLTIFGIVIGIYALIMMGSIAEKLTILVQGGVRYYNGKVTVVEESGGNFQSQPLSVDKISELERIDGVARASAGVGMLLDKEMSAFSVGMPSLINGSDFRDEGYETFPITYTEGRELKKGDDGKVVIGSDMVKSLNAKVGGKVEIRDKKFEVVGIAGKTLTAPDNMVSMTLQDAQELYMEDLPEVVRNSVDERKIATSITVFPKAGVNADELAKKINKKVSGVKAQGPKAFQDSVVEPMKPFNAVIFGVALISLIIGGLSIINTMTMAISERTKEIGIRKAIGASDSSILFQFVAEAAVIGLIGGLIGLLLGWLSVTVLNYAGEASNMAIFLLTSRLVIGSLAFSLFLGIFSGLYPAWHAARMDPIKALKYE